MTWTQELLQQLYTGNCIISTTNVKCTPRRNWGWPTQNYKTHRKQQQQLWYWWQCNVYQMIMSQTLHLMKTMIMSQKLHIMKMPMSYMKKSAFSRSMQMINRMGWHEIHDDMLKFRIHPPQVALILQKLHLECLQRHQLNLSFSQRDSSKTVFAFHHDQN